MLTTGESNSTLVEVEEPQMKRVWKAIVNVVKTFIEIIRAMEYEARNRYEGRDK